MLPTGCESADGGCIESTQLAEDGRDRSGGPVRQNVPAIQRSTHSKEKDARKKAHVESGVQREFRVRHPGVATERQRDTERPGPLARLMQRARERQSRVPFVGLG